MSMIPESALYRPSVPDDGDYDYRRVLPARGRDRKRAPSKSAALRRDAWAWRAVLELSHLGCANAITGGEQIAALMYARASLPERASFVIEFTEDVGLLVMWAEEFEPGATKAATMIDSNAYQRIKD